MDGTIDTAVGLTDVLATLSVASHALAAIEAHPESRQSRARFTKASKSVEVDMQQVRAMLLAGASASE